MQRPSHPTQCWRPTNREYYFIILGDGDIAKLQVWQEAEQARDGMQEYFANFHKSMEGKGMPK